MNQNQQQYLQSAVQVLKEHGMEVNVKNISHFVNGAIPENIIQEWMNDEWDQVRNTEAGPLSDKQWEQVRNTEAGPLSDKQWEQVRNTEDPSYDCN
jgi:hypothetical protein